MSALPMAAADLVVGLSAAEISVCSVLKESMASLSMRSFFWTVLDSVGSGGGSLRRGAMGWRGKGARVANGLMKETFK